MNKEKLLEDLKVAKEKALAYKNETDGGTCNIDTPLIKLEGTNEQELQELIGEEYGVCHYNGDWYEIAFKVMSGQAHRRTMMAMEFILTLRELGYKSYVHWVID
jgi:hypothetical protein